MDSKADVSSSNSLLFKTEDPSCSYENNLHIELEDLFLVEHENDQSFPLEPLYTKQETPQEYSEADEILLSDEEEDEITAPFNEEMEIETLERTPLSLQDVKPLPDNMRTMAVYVNEEESAVISECQDPKLKNLLILNRAKAAHLMETVKKLLQLENELLAFVNQQKMSKTRSLDDEELQSMRKTYVWRIGMPFFKDKSFYRAPHNPDYSAKKDNKELLSVVIKDGPKWSLKDQKILENAVLESYHSYRKNKQEQEIRISRMQMAKNPEHEDNLELLLEELETFKKKREPPPLNCDEGIDWLKISSTDLKGRHPYQQCKAFWNIYLHPYINKSNWTTEENQKIKELVSCHQFDWELIARELNTNRSPYLVCIHFNTKLCDKFKRERFLPDEDDLLMEVIEHCRLGDYIPWGKVAYYFENRSKSQLYHRYQYYLSCCDRVKKGVFTEAEDILLLHLVDRFGKNYSKITQYIPRSMVQLRNRFSNYLEKMLCIKLGNFSADDDRKIMRHVETHGFKNWNILAKDLNRTRAHVRQRYITIKKILNEDPGKTIADMPRRTQTYFLQNYSNKRARYKSCLEQLQSLKGIPKLSTVEVFLNNVGSNVTNELRVNKGIPFKKKQRSDMDEQLVDFFMGTCRVQRRCKLALTDSAARVTNLLSFLQLDLDLVQSANVEGLPNDDMEMLQNIKDFINTTSFKPPAAQTFQLLPPTVNTLLALRGLLVKYQLNKDTIEKPPPPQDEQSGEQRELFYTRLYAVLKWPSILSRNFPARLGEEQQEKEVQVEPVKRKPGRPSKSYDKIQKMVEAKKRKRMGESLVVKEEPQAESRSKLLKPAYAKVMKVVEARKMKQSSPEKKSEKKRGRPPGGEHLGHDVAYVSRKYNTRRSKGDVKQIEILPSTSCCDNQSQLSIENELVVNPGGGADKDVNSEFIKKYSVRLEEMSDESSDDEIESHVLNTHKNIDNLKSTIQRIQRVLQEKNLK